MYMHGIIVQIFLVFICCKTMVIHGAPSPVPTKDDNHDHDHEDSDLPADWEDLIRESVAQTNNSGVDASLLQRTDLYEGDIMVMPIDAEHPSGSGGTLMYTAVRNRNVLWRNGVVPFTIAQGYSSQQQSTIVKALNDIMSKTCIKFVRRTNERDYVTFINGNQGCSSYIARVGGQQLVQLANGCIQHGIVQHETIHLLGFDHEQNRRDRDNFVTIVFSNIDRRMEHNFQKNVDSDSLNLAYDYGSLMHYDRTAFAKNPNFPTIVPKRRSVAIGQRQQMSPTDIQKINILYQCNGARGPTPSPVGGTGNRVAGRRRDEEGLEQANITDASGIDAGVKTGLSTSPGNTTVAGLSNIKKPKSSASFVSWTVWSTLFFSTGTNPFL
ncbi:astacin-like [Paramacrobiotus metropolitanus]|uniref:astacin-like n=1 Tax=Paramacrobiotus metropolitanus TaxID=2943436 RepID=UPI002445C401|nr:astacin-like [Paramacrobiotus metropolitanus]